MSIGRIPSNDPEAIRARLNFEKAQEDLRTEGLKSLGSVRRVQRAADDMVKAEKLGHEREDARRKESARMKAELWSVKTILCVLAVLGCLFALVDMPGDFYKVLRFVVVAACVAVIWDVQKSGAGERKKTVVSVLFGLLAVIYNPILPLEMDRGAWAWFDVGAVGMVLCASFPVWEKLKSAFAAVAETEI